MVDKLICFKKNREHSVMIFFVFYNLLDSAFIKLVLVNQPKVFTKSVLFGFLEFFDGVR